MIVMDDTACMVDVARYFMDFCREESCGKCIPCRSAPPSSTPCSPRSEGDATLDDLDQLESLSDMVKHTSLCGLGQSAPTRCSRPCATSEEYLAHIQDRTCPAGSARSPTGGGAHVSVYTLRIDGTDVAGAAGQSILEVAAENGIEIPTLCHLDGLSDVGACRLCVVEVGGRASCCRRV